MADEDRKSFPSIPTRNWWDLRARFKQSVPGKVGRDYLQSVLSVGEGHAKNLIPQLKAVGLIDDDGKPTDLAHDWRDDKTYTDAATRIREQTYPQGLLDALPPPTPARSAVEGWFSRNAKVGEGAARKMASFYLLLCEADPGGQQAEVKPREPKPAAKRGTPRQRAASKPAAEAAKAAQTAKVERNGEGPSVHVDVQVHISPDASAEQIDQIFAAMAKHFYSR